jgi:hypothetical protein
MLAKFKNRWLRPRVLGVIAAKIILSGTTVMPLGLSTFPCTPINNCSSPGLVSSPTTETFQHGGTEIHRVKTQASIPFLKCTN